jgi:hypothetical protein
MVEAMRNATFVYRIVSMGFILLVFALAACSSSQSTTTNTSTPTPTQQQANTTPVSSVPTSPLNHPPTPIVATPVTTPASGPIVIETPTPAPGGSAHSQLVKLPDRTLTIQNVSEQPGGSNSTNVTLVLSISNTGTKAIPNEATYYQLVGMEGDIFGLQSSVTSGFYGTVATHSSHNGTIIFQVPSAASKGLRLLFRSEIATETVFVQLGV